jgi:pentatricopeptide repeat protein
MDVAMRAAHTGMEDIRTFTKSRKTEKFGGEKRQDHRSTVKKTSPPVVVDLNEVDFLSTPPKALQDMYSSLCAEGRLDDALFVIKQSIRAGRDDALRMFKHYEFLRCAARKKSVHYGMRFVQLFPRKHVDARTYNMLVSVCAEAGDVKAALRSADMLKASGLKLDTILYTNLIKVCAAASNADRAFEIFKEMTSAGIKVEKHVFATMLNACAAQIVTLNHEADRRNQLVLLERAFELVDSMSDLNVRPDAAVWNALITVAGKAEKLQRAFDVLDEMISKGEKPNARTYVALIDTCARTGDQDLALRIYKRAMMEGHTNELKIYSAAINACVKSKNGADVQGAMEIFADLQRAGVNGDSALYGALIMAAGRSGNLELAMDLNDEMLRDGLEPCPGTESALITIFVQNGELEKAEEIYHRMNKSGIVPHMHAFNALINSEAKAMRLGSVTTLVRDMISCGLQPDAFTFTAVLNACQHSKQSELALDVYRVMRMRGIRVDEVHALLLLKICYSELRKIWDAAASDNARNTYSSAGISRSKEKLELLSVLSPLGKQYVPKDNSSDVPWQSHACQIYRDALTAGVKPSLPLLNMAMMCLKVPLYIARGFGPSTEDLAAQTLQLHAGWQPRAGAYEPEVQRKIGLESIYHVQALSFMEDAIVGGHLPAFTVDGTEPHDLTEYPPAVAEVYALLLLQASQRQVVDGRRYLKNNIKFLVPSYDRKKVFLPSFEESEDTRFRQELADRYEKIVADSPNLPPELRMLFPNDMDRSKPRQPKQTSSEATGLGVAAVLRRLRIGAKESGSAGTIIVEARDAARWAKRIQKEIERRSASALALQKPYGQQISSSLLQKSQSSIRMSGSS